MEVDIGMTKKQRSDCAKMLSKFLANTYAVYLKTQNFHWNIVGSDFYSLHILFEKHYEELAKAIDEIAERIRSLGFFAEGSFTSFKKKMTIKEEDKPLSAPKMLRSLLKAHETISKEGRPLIKESQDLNDDITSDLFIRRVTFHDKAAWMIRSHL